MLSPYTVPLIRYSGVFWIRTSPCRRVVGVGGEETDGTCRKTLEDGVAEEHETRAATTASNAAALFMEPPIVAWN